MTLSPEELEALQTQADKVRDEGKHVARRSRLLVQMAAELSSMAAQALESEEDTRKNATEQGR